jgi:hypothetical protein
VIPVDFAGETGRIRALGPGASSYEGSMGDRRMRLRFGLLLVAALLVLSGCQLPSRTTGLGLWAAESDQLLFPDTARQRDNDVFSESQGRVSLAGGVNETVAFQLVVPGRSPADAVVSLKLSDLSGTAGWIAAQNIALYREAFVRVDSSPAWFYQRTPYRRATREYPDVLVPVAAGSTALPAEATADRNVVFWIDVHVPPGTAAGTYTGQLVVQTRSQARAQLTVELEVWPFALPDTPHVVAVAPLRWATLVAHNLERDGKPYRPQRLVSDDPLRPQALAVLDATFRLLRAHRCNGLVTDLYPLRQTTADGQMQIDWVDYDTVASAYLDGSTFEDRVPLPVWALPVDEQHPPPAAYGGPNSRRYSEAVRETVQACLAHFQQRGWLDRHVMLLFASAGHLGDEYASYQAMAKTFRAAGQGVRLWCDLPAQSMEPFGWAGHPFIDLGKLVGVWCPPARFADPATLSAIRKGGGRSWWQPDRPPYSGSLAIVSPPVDVRSIPWQAARWSSDAVWLGGAADWPFEPVAGGAAQRVDADATWLLYPGRPYGLDAPVPSIRLKRLRDGLQDAEYLWLLRQQRRPAVADLVADSLFAFGGAGAYGENYADGRAHGWVRDPAMWRLGRQLLAAEIQRAAAGESAEEPDQFRQRLEWQRFLAGTRRVLAWCNGVRVRGEADAGPLAARIEADVSVLNQASRAAQAQMDCGSLPAGWKVLTQAPRFDVPPGQVARRSLAIQAAAIDYDAIDRTGLMSLPVFLDGGAGNRMETPARMALLDAQRIGRPITVDGNLEDWPPGLGNVAGDFVLVGGQDVPKTGDGKPDRPSQGTLAFVCYDDDSLYIAFNCEEQHVDQREIAQTNFVRYEGMTPIGEDLVEVLFDPGATAVGPGDLYHLVVKANGAVVTERGIGCRPPIGAHRNWPADVRVGIKAASGADRWFVEVQVRRDSFGGDARRRPYWGINFARLESRLGEYSTWSGARWNVYTPTTLGNLHIGG